MLRWEGLNVTWEVLVLMGGVKCNVGGAGVEMGGVKCNVGGAGVEMGGVTCNVGGAGVEMGGVKAGKMQSHGQ